MLRIWLTNPPFLMSISVFTLLDDTKAISMPEKNPASTSAEMVRMRYGVNCSTEVYLVKCRESGIVDRDYGLHAIDLVGGDLFV